MELELLQYHKSNAALDLMIGEMRLKRDGVAREVRKCVWFPLIPCPDSVLRMRIR